MAPSEGWFSKLMSKVAIYARVSTDEQTVDNQLPLIEAHAQGRGYEVAEVYQESETAWKAGHQRELSRLLDDIRSGRRKYDYLMVWSLDRLCRLGIGPVLQLISTFETYGCHVISLKESWTEVDGPMRELFIAIAAWVGKFESDRRSERTRAGLERVRANGRRLGRPPGKKDGKPRRKKRPVVYRYGGASVAASEQ